MDNRLDKVIGKDEYRTCEKCGQTRNFTESPECARCKWGASKRFNPRHHKKKDDE